VSIFLHTCPRGASLDAIAAHLADNGVKIPKAKLEEALKKLPLLFKVAKYDGEKDRWTLVVFDYFR
jgi:hypothetical protein